MVEHFAKQKACRSDKILGANTDQRVGRQGVRRRLLANIKFLRFGEIVCHDITRRSCPAIHFADQQAQQFGDQRRLRLAFDLERAIEVQQHPRIALRVGSAQLGARRARAIAPLLA